jgi:hypothetical protein
VILAVFTDSSLPDIDDLTVFRFIGLK